MSLDTNFIKFAIPLKRDFCRRRWSVEQLTILCCWFHISLRCCLSVSLVDIINLLFFFVDTILRVHWTSSEGFDLHSEIGSTARLLIGRISICWKHSRYFFDLTSTIHYRCVWAAGTSHINMFSLILSIEIEWVISKDIASKIIIGQNS